MAAWVLKEFKIKSNYPTIACPAYRTLVGLFTRVNAHVIEQFVASIEGSIGPRTADPVAGVVVLTVALLVNVTVLNVQNLQFGAAIISSFSMTAQHAKTYQLRLRTKLLVAVHPIAKVYIA